MAISDELRKLVDPNNECCCEHCLSNKCKEWAWDKQYCVMSFKVQGYDTWTVEINELDDDRNFIIDGVSTEPEAIFKACQYILDKEVKMSKVSTAEDMKEYAAKASKTFSK